MPTKSPRRAWVWETMPLRLAVRAAPAVSAVQHRGGGGHHRISGGWRKEVRAGSEESVTLTPRGCSLPGPQMGVEDTPWAPSAFLCVSAEKPGLTKLAQERPRRSGHSRGRSAEVAGSHHQSLAKTFPWGHCSIIISTCSLCAHGISTTECPLLVWRGCPWILGKEIQVLFLL